MLILISILLGLYKTEILFDVLYTVGLISEFLDPLIIHLSKLLMFLNLVYVVVQRRFNYFDAI